MTETKTNYREIAVKKQEIMDLEERAVSKEQEVNRYRDQYQRTHALYVSLDDDITIFEQKGDPGWVEGFTEDLHYHERRRKDLKSVKDMLDDLQGVVDKAYKVFSDSERAPLPESVKDEPLLHKASTLLGEPGECPVCSGGAVRNTLDERRKELKDCATDFAKAMRVEEGEMKVIKADIREHQDRIEGINAKRRERDKAKRDSADLLKELDERKNLYDGVNDEITYKRRELAVLEQQYAQDENDD